MGSGAALRKLSALVHLQKARLLRALPSRTRAECGARSWQLGGYAICREDRDHPGNHCWEIQ